MDKEFSLTTVTVISIHGPAAAYVAARYSPRLMLLLVPLLAFVFWAHLSEFVDPFVGPALYREAGPVYFAVSWLGPALVGAAIASGIIFRRKEKRDA
jgi:hypothetical protein